MNNSSIVLEARSISKIFTDPVPKQVLNEISFTQQRGEFVSITGRSGCGKSTLLYILSTMDTDYTGDLLIDGESMRDKTDSELAVIRNEKIGFVFQFHYLLNEFSVLKNVMLPGFKRNLYSDEELEVRAMELLRTLGMESLATMMAYRLSGGEKQRVAIARAMINDPLIILCDEPTGNLDNRNSDIVFQTFKELSETYGTTLLVVTHDLSFAEQTGRIIEMDDGRIVG